ncbi:MAG: adenosylhomocysteinase [Deferribacterota bacterium]|nr:adenosylhomocysteinase [Deferribacterota bacterium]
MNDYHVKDIEKAFRGLKRINWADLEMPVLRSIRNDFSKSKVLKDLRISCCLHVTTETANLVRTLKSGGADVLLCASNPLSTQDDVAASLVKDFDIPVYAIRGEDNNIYYDHIRKAIDHKPHIIMDDGADLISTVMKEGGSVIENVIGSTEETTTGVIRLKSLERNNLLKFPVIAVNDAHTKYLFDNRYGTGQSTLDGIIRATNTLIAGKVVTIAGYGWCGKGVAAKARGMGANVIITEVDPIKSLEAVMDGFLVMPMQEAVKKSDIVITVTGNIDVLTKEHYKVMKNRCIICNAGHFNVEINIKDLENLAKEIRSNVRDNVDEYILEDDRRIYLIAGGRLVNLSAAEGHPPMVMDMSFSTQAKAVEYLLLNKGSLASKVLTIPDYIEKVIAKIKLGSLNISIDALSENQEKYLSSWEFGT